MSRSIAAFEFSETAIGNRPDAVVCVVLVAELRSFMSVDEVDAAFSGYISYRQTPWMKRYVGVWGRKNCQRFRRFLRERGADLSLFRARPLRLLLIKYVTRGVREKTRFLDPLVAPTDVH